MKPPPVETGMLEETIARTATGLLQKDPPGQTIHLLKRNLIDSYAGICASFLDEKMVGTMGRYAALCRDPGGVAVWGTGTKAAPGQAVFLNTILGRRSDLVNTYLSPGNMGGNHPSDNVALLLTLADWKNLSGMELIRAMHAAYVLSCAFSDYYNPEAAGYDHDAAAPLYTTLIAGLVMGLDRGGLTEAQRIAGAMGIDVDQTGVGLVTDWKHCTYASCAMRGFEAARMARAGFAGPVDIYRGKAGWDRFMPHAEDFMPQRPDLGRIVFKRWQALVFCQTAIDAAVELSPVFLKRGRQKLKSIRVETYAKALHEAGGEGCRRPASRAGRTHSLPYCVLAALAGGGVDYDSFGDAAARHPRMTGLIEKIDLLEDKQMTVAFPAKAPCRIILEYEGGESPSAYRAQPHGDPADPLSDEEVGAKAEEHLSRLLPRGGAKELVRKMWELEDQADLAWLTASLRQGASHA